MSDEIPVGTIMMWSGQLSGSNNSLHSPYSNWHLCDGTWLSQSSYPQLFSAIQFNYGLETESPFGRGHFPLPDLRGCFIRGTTYGATRSDGSTIDPDASSRYLPLRNNGYNGLSGSIQVGDVVGSMQESALPTHAHPTHGHPPGFPFTAKDKQINGGNGWQPGYTGDSLTFTNNNGKFNSWSQASIEARPINVNLNYIIKVLPGNS